MSEQPERRRGDCNTCVYAVYVEGPTPEADRYECHRNPPNVAGQYLTVQAGGWCGEYTAAEPLRSV